MEVSIVFMFHSLFMTKTDQTVKVQCFYMEADKHVTVPLSVRLVIHRVHNKFRVFGLLSEWDQGCRFLDFS